MSGHAGELCVGKVGEVSVACLRGRVHLYEGHEPERVVFGVRLLETAFPDAPTQFEARRNICRSCDLDVLSRKSRSFRRFCEELEALPLRGAG